MSLRCTDSGRSGADAPAVLAVHGITSTSFAWLPVAAALADDVSLIAVDLRGRGQSGSLPGPFGLDAHVEDLVAVLDTLALQQPVVLGHSMGSYIAARLGVQHPDRVSRLVLVDGGLTVPGSADVDPEPFMRAFLGPALARLEMTFESRRRVRRVVGCSTRRSTARTSTRGSCGATSSTTSSAIRRRCARRSTPTC